MQFSILKKKNLSLRVPGILLLFFLRADVTASKDSLWLFEAVACSTDVALCVQCSAERQERTN